MSRRHALPRWFTTLPPTVGQLPLSFIPNMGQIADRHVRFQGALQPSIDAAGNLQITLPITLPVDPGPPLVPAATPDPTVLSATVSSGADGAAAPTAEPAPSTDNADTATPVADTSIVTSGGLAQAATTTITLTEQVIVTTTVFDGLGRTTVITDVLGAATRSGYNGLDQTVVMTDTMGRVTRAGYDGSGALRWQATPDGRGQRTRLTYPGSAAVITSGADVRVLVEEDAGEGRGGRRCRRWRGEGQAQQGEGGEGQSEAAHPELLDL